MCEVVLRIEERPDKSSKIKMVVNECSATDNERRAATAIFDTLNRLVRVVARASSFKEKPTDAN